jgi:hypothetical protein
MSGINYLARLKESWAVAPQTPVSYVCSICYRNGGGAKYFGAEWFGPHGPHGWRKRLYQAAVAHLATAHGKRLQRNRMGRWMMVATNEQGVK